MACTKKNCFPFYLTLPYLGFYAVQAIYTTYFNLYLDDIGYTKMQMGAFTSAATFLVMIVQPLWGVASDKSKSRNTIVKLLLVLGGITALGFYLNLNYYFVLILNCIFCVFFYPLSPLIDNITLESLDEVKNRKYNFGDIRIAGTIGYCGGVLAAGKLLNNQYQRMFLMISVLFAFTLLCMRRVPSVQGFKKEKKQHFFRELLGSKKILCFIFLQIIFTLGTTNFYSYYPLYFSSIGGNSSLVGILMFVCALSEIPLWPLCNRLVKKIGYQKVMAIAGAFTALRWYILYVTTNPYIAIVANLTHGIGFVTLNFSLVTFINEKMPRSLHATGQSMVNMITTIFSRIIGGVVIGYLCDRWGIKNVMFLNFIMIIIGVIVFEISFGLLNRAEQKSSQTLMEA